MENIKGIRKATRSKRHYRLNKFDKYIRCKYSRYCKYSLGDLIIEFYNENSNNELDTSKVLFLTGRLYEFLMKNKDAFIIAMRNTPPDQLE